MSESIQILLITLSEITKTANWINIGINYIEHEATFCQFRQQSTDTLTTVTLIREKNVNIQQNQNQNVISISTTYLVALYVYAVQ